MQSATRTTNNSVKFYPSYSRSYGKNGALILSQLDYWHERCSLETHPEGFYKFLKPCKHRDYRENDSWLEELAIHPKSFYRAFKNIGVHYDSRTIYEKEFKKHGTGVFKGKPWLKIYDRYSNKTYFLKNSEYKKMVHNFDELVCKENNSKRNNFLVHQNYEPLSEQGVYSADEPVCLKNNSDKGKNFPAHQQNKPSIPEENFQTTEMEVVKVHSPLIHHPDKKTNKNFHKEKIFLDAQKSRDSLVSVIDKPECPVGIGQNVLSPLYIESNITSQNTSSHARAREKKFNKEKGTANTGQLAEQMATIWNSEVRDKVNPDNRQRAFLIQALRDKFEGSLNKWRDFCRRIGASKFLMGKRSSWFDLDWVLIFRNMEKILRGKLGWDAPPIISSEHQEKLIDENNKSIEEEKNMNLKEFKQELRKRLKESEYNGLITKSKMEYRVSGEIILTFCSSFAAERLALPSKQNQIITQVVDCLKISSLKVIANDREYLRYPFKKFTSQEKENNLSLLEKLRESLVCSKIGYQNI